MSTISATITHGVTLGSGTYTSPLTVTSTGAVEPSSGTVGIFGSSSQAWTVANYGTIAVSGTSSRGVDLRHGGYVNNAGLISAGAPIYIGGAVGTVKNTGTLWSPSTIGEGITLAMGGLIDNSGSIISANGIYFQSGSGTLTNAGVIVGTAFFDPNLDYGAAVYFKINVPGIVLNSGTIRQFADNQNFAVELQDGGTIINYAGGLIEAITGIKLNTYTYQSKFHETNTNIATVVNAGTISGTAGTVGTAVSIAVNLGNGGSVDNQATGVIKAGLGVYVGALTVAAKHTPVNTGTVTNAGTVTGSVSYGIEFLIGGSVNNSGRISGVSDDILIKGGTGTVTNSGTIEGPNGTQNFGVYLAAGGTVSNQAGGLIEANTPVYIKGTAGIVTNAGTILGAGGLGVALAVGGSVNNAVGGLIEDATAVQISGSAGTVNNAGTLVGTNGPAVELNAGGRIDNTAMLVGASGVYVLNSAATVTNTATILGTTNTGIILKAGGTVVNSGTIGGAGNTAISFGGKGSNLLVLQHGYKLTGGVAGATTASDTLGLAGSVANALTVNYASLGLSSFENVLFGTGGYNTLKINKNSGTFGLKISGFDQTTEVIDLTAIGSNGTISQNDTLNHRLTISGASGTVTLQFDATDASSFITSSDGSGGTDLTTACYCRGTLILTDRGEVPIEVLAVGARVVTRSGGLRRVKWIGRRSYAGWLAAGNPKVLPVCFKRGSLSDGVPRRDLWVSPEHAMYLDGALVPAELLVNGVSILKAERVEEVHYYHLELDQHEVILAEGAWAESFVDDDSRGMFHNAAEYRELYPAAPAPPAARYCAPRLEEGFELDALRRQLMDRARRLDADGTPPPLAGDPSGEPNGDPSSGSLQGNLEVVTHQRIAGWAYDPAAPALPVALVVYADDAEIGRLSADRYRADLEAAGIGCGRHAFELAVPQGLDAGRAHRVAVCREADGARLPGSPRRLDALPGAVPAALPAAAADPPADASGAAPAAAEAAVPLGRLLGNLEGADRTQICGWAADAADPERAVGLSVTIDGEAVGRVLANRHRHDLEKAGIGHGRHGFALLLPAPLSLAAHRIGVTREADGAELPGSPLLLGPPTRLDAAAEAALALSLASLADDDEERALALLVRETERLLSRRAERHSGRAAREALVRHHRRWGRRWGSQTAAGPAEAAADAGAGSRALVIDAALPDPGRDAGSVAILSHIRGLQQLGYQVSFAAAEPAGETAGEAATRERLEAAGVAVCGRPFYASIEDVLCRQAGTFDLVYLHRAPLADRYLPLARRWCPRARILYSVADLHHLRLARQAEIEGRPELTAHSRQLALIEALAAQRADIVLTHSPVEAALLRRWVGPHKVHVVPFAVAVGGPRRPFAERAGILFIGGPAHAPNGDGAHHLARDILPLVWERDPEIACRIVGPGWEARPKPCLDPRLEIAGAVRDLDSLFDQVRLSVAPLRFGAGIKGKVLDSFAAHLPCVMTGVAAEGLPLAGPLAELVAEGPAAFARLILTLHHDEAANAKYAQAAAALAASHFSQDHVTAALAAALSLPSPKSFAQPPATASAVA